MLHALIGLDFVVVGTPRSGTTLVQRLASELEGVRLPLETHFFSLFAPGLLRRATFPLAGDRLLREIEAYGATVSSRGLVIDAEQVARGLGRRAGTMADLFAAVARHAAGPGRVYGEKTPSHLAWWPYLTAAFPALKVVGVVRDPRAVVASNLAVPWGMSRPAVLAERWRVDQRDLREAAAALGDRLSILRYEEVVSDPLAAQRTLATFLGTSGPTGLPGTPVPVEPWKSAAFGTITENRVDGWRRVLTPRQAAQVSAVAGKEMARHGYGHASDREHGVLLSPWDHIARLRFRAARRRQRRDVGRALTTLRPDGS